MYQQIILAIYAGTVAPDAAAAVAHSEVPRRRRGRRRAERQAVSAGQILATGGKVRAFVT